jgi:protein-disulfide isomerase
MPYAPALRRLAIALALSLPAVSPSIAFADDAAVTREMIVNDPVAPKAGNPKGDVTIVAYLDYNCPYCKQCAPALDQLVKSDGKVRVVYKDWPVLTEASVYGAKLALAAKYQGKYDEVHAALMSIPGRKIPEDKMLAAIKGSGVDMARLQADAEAHDAEIAALLKRNDAQAKGLNLQGTPVYLVGPLLVAAAPDLAQFREAVAERASAPANRDLRSRPRHVRVCVFPPGDDRRPARAAQRMRQHAAHRRDDGRPARRSRRGRALRREAERALSGAARRPTEGGSPEPPAAGRLPDRRAARNDRRRSARPVPLFGPGERKGAALRRRRRQGGS